MEGGALPELFMLPNEETKRNYVSAIKDTVLLRDIIQRHNIKDAKLLEDIFVYLVNNASCLISITGITNYFKSNGRRVSYDTVSNYIGYIEDAFMIHKAERYDIRGKDTISGNCKYYTMTLLLKITSIPDSDTASATNWKIWSIWNFAGQGSRFMWARSKIKK